MVSTVRTRHIAVMKISKPSSVGRDSALAVPVRGRVPVLGNKGYVGVYITIGLRGGIRTCSKPPTKWGHM